MSGNFPTPERFSHRIFPRFRNSRNVIESPRYESQANLIAILWFAKLWLYLKQRGHFAEEVATHRWYAKRTLRERFNHASIP